MTPSPRYAFAAPPELRGAAPPELRGPGPRRPVAVIGSGPVGLTCALDLATRGIPVVVLDDDDTVASGSRAICWAKRTLEIWDRLGVAEAMVAQGVTWNVGGSSTATANSTASTCCPNPATAARPSSTSRNTPSSGS